jgi:UDP-galactopyranose mutase
MRQNSVHIIGAGITGAVIASRINKDVRDVYIYERDEIGGTCVDNECYQKYVHIFRSDNESVIKYLCERTDARPYMHHIMSFVDGRYFPWMPLTINQKVIDKQITNYGIKFWRGDPPDEVSLVSSKRYTNKTGTLFGNKKQFILNYKKLFNNLLEWSCIEHKSIDCNNKFPEGDVVILTGSIDEYYDYCFGSLSYRGIKSCHCQSEQGLIVPVVNFPNDFPFIRMIDYQRLGYLNYIGFEFPSDDKHYPVITKEMNELYGKYKILADRDGIILAGRLGTYQYLDIEQCILQAFEISDRINKTS